MKYFIFLLFILSTSLSLIAQVGVNTETPEQALDVEGKVAIGDDNAPATEGTLRYNTTTRNFEGFDGEEWGTLTNVAALSGGAIPAGAIPVYGETLPISANDEIEDARIYNAATGFRTTTVPANTFLVVTWVNIRDNDINPLPDQVLVRVSARTSASAFLDANRSITLSGSLDKTIWTESSLAPLIVVRPGELLAASNSRFSEDVVHMQFRGFLVPSLDY